MGSLHAMQAIWVLFALLLATRTASSSPPLDASTSMEEQAEDSVPSEGHNSAIEKRGGSWSQLQGAWGKRGGWSQLHGAWGKRADYPERDEEDLLQEAPESKRGANWNSLQGSWGKRATWSNLQGSWGKRDAPLALIDTLEKRARWHDLQGSWGKRDWSQLHGAWGKRGYPGDEAADEGGVAGVAVPDDSDYTSGATLPLQKRVWSKFVGSWGKRPDTLRPLSSRSANWSSLRGSWGKRGSNWSSMRGSWGKRGEPGVEDEVAASDVMGLK